MQPGTDVDGSVGLRNAGSARLVRGNARSDQRDGHVGGPVAELAITGYELRWRSNSDADWTNVTGLASTATSYTITGLLPQTTYQVRVRAMFGGYQIGTYSSLTLTDDD